MSYSSPPFYKLNEDSLHLVSLARADFNRFVQSGYFKALDLGTGAGALPIFLEEEISHEGARRSWVLVERLPEFIPHLKENLKNSKVEQKVEIIEKNYFDINFQGSKFDFIVANPPYFAFGKGRPSPDRNKQDSRTWREGEDILRFLKLCSCLLSKEGILWLVLRESLSIEVAPVFKNSKRCIYRLTLSDLLNAEGI